MSNVEFVCTIHLITYLIHQALCMFNQRGAGVHQTFSDGVTFLRLGFCIAYRTGSEAQTFNNIKILFLTVV